MEVVDMVGMVATEGVVEVVVTAVEVVAMEVDVEAVEVDMVVVDMAAVATRPSLDQKNLHKKHFRYKISIHAYLVLFCYAVLSLKNNCIFFAFDIRPFQLNSKLQSKTL